MKKQTWKNIGGRDNIERALLTIDGRKPSLKIVEATNDINIDGARMDVKFGSSSSRRTFYITKQFFSQRGSGEIVENSSGPSQADDGF